MILLANVVDGRHLDMWASRGLHKIGTPPIWPRFYSYYKREGSIPVQMRLLSDVTKEVTLYRVDVENARWIRGMRDEESLEAAIPFDQLLVIALGFPHPDVQPHHDAWDIEMVTAGQFPNFKRDAITEISWWSPRRQEVLQGDEVSILEGFNDICESEDTDIYDTYNGGRFDWRALRARFAVNKMKLHVGRLGDPARIVERERRYGRFKGFDYTVFMSGRLSFDVWKEVCFDTSLTGKVKNRQLKTVARHMFPDEDFIVLDRSNLGKYTAKERADYCLSDSRATWLLAEHYMHIIKMLAHELRAPLDMIIRRLPSHTGNYAYGAEFKKLNVVSDGPNYQRFIGKLWDE